MVEDTRVHSTSTNAAGHNDEKQIETLAQVDKGENVRQPASDVKEGDLVLEKGTVLTSAGGEIGTLAFVGRTEVRYMMFYIRSCGLIAYLYCDNQVKVYPKPVVAVLSTGNELRDLLDSHSNATTWDTNRPSLQAALEGMGFEVVDLGIVVDE